MRCALHQSVKELRKLVSDKIDPHHRMRPFSKSSMCWLFERAVGLSPTSLLFVRISHFRCCTISIALWSLCWHSTACSDFTVRGCFAKDNGTANCRGKVIERERLRLREKHHRERPMEQATGTGIENHIQQHREKHIKMLPEEEGTTGWQQKALLSQDILSAVVHQFH